MKLKRLFIECDVVPSTSIFEASEEACRLANELGCQVRFEFNGTKCRAYPGGSAETLARSWESVGEARRVASRMVAWTGGVFDSEQQPNGPEKT